MPIVHVPEALREKLGPEGAQARVDLLNQTGREARNDVLLLVEERFSRRVAEAEARFERRLAEEVGELRKEIGALETSLETKTGALSHEVAGLRTEFKSQLETRIAAAQTRLIQWSFAFWASLMAALFLRT